MNQLDLKGRHAVITGGAVGLGYAIAQRMLASGAGVTLWDRDEAALAKATQALGSRARGVRVDVSRHADVVEVSRRFQTLINYPSIPKEIALSREVRLRIR